MIKVINGDITKAEENIIVHQVNCQAKMASGVAKSIRKAFPRAYTEYMSMFDKVEDPEHLLGHAQIIQVDESVFSDKFIVNLFGQLNYGYDGQRYTSYDALWDGLSYVKTHAKRASKSVAIPYGIGSVRGGANWDVVYKMIETIFHDYDVTLYRYEEKK